MALPDYWKISAGTPIVFKSSGGDGAITLASLANGSYRQSTKADFGALRAARYLVELEIEMAATPTSGNRFTLWLNPSSSSTAGTDNKGGCSGSDASYSGYSSNAAASVLHLLYIEDFIVTAQATSTVQKIAARAFVEVPLRYGSIVLLNSAGSAVHSSDTNCLVRFTPILDSLED